MIIHKKHHFDDHTANAATSKKKDYCHCVFVHDCKERMQNTEALFG
jgi:hypothetical protein